MTTSARAARGASRFWRHEYWLEHSEGYRVETPEGLLGFVEEVVRDPRTGEPTALLVRRTDGGFALASAPVACVREVRPETEEIVLVDM